jgi:hypothetical protein
MKYFLWCSSVFCGSLFLSADPLLQQALPFFERHCFECHSGEEDSVEGGVHLEEPSLDGTKQVDVDFWTRVHEVIQSGEMPPRDAQSIPNLDEREVVLVGLSEFLTQHAPVGGTLPRRLNRVEYEHTIRALFDYPDFVTPPSFPADDSRDGFDNVASGLVLSPPLLEKYLQIATAIADEFLPAPISLAYHEPEKHRVPPSTLSTEEGGGGALAQDAYRLVSSRNMASAAGWTASYEVPANGIYKILIETRSFQSDTMFSDKRNQPFRLEVYARPNGEKKYSLFQELRLLNVLSIAADGKPVQDLSFETELFQGEVLGFRWADGPVYSDPDSRELAHAFIDDRLLNDRRFYAAAIQLNGGKRGVTQVEFYEAIRQLMESGTLDLSDPQLDRPPAVYGGGLSNGPHNWCKNYVHEEMHRFGPALDILGVQVEGPSRLTSSQLERRRLARSEQFLGLRDVDMSDMDFAEVVLRRFLSRAFRRPISDVSLEGYMELVRAHRLKYPEKRLQDALHLAVRRALISPNFLYQGLKTGRLDDWDLASRLSYFLSSAPPDAKLRNMAASRKLSNPVALAHETRRLLGKKHRRAFVRNFTGQWLGTRMLKDIMPDPRLLKFFDHDRASLVRETERFFEEILHENLTLDHFIDPGFSFRNKALNKIYGGTLSDNTMRRVNFKKGGVQGGLLGLASIMMATGNGVDTHPVHRGVWLLENVLGQPTPPPPPEVPAVAPDTSGTTTMRELMAAHQADAACARCHEKIDPLGFVMEHFDPVGRWRDHYPVYTQASSAPLKEEFYASKGEGARVGRSIDGSAEMPDGTLLNGVVDLKGYLLSNIDLFAVCLTEKLLTYATGRSLGFGDRRVAEQVAEDLVESEGGFQDLVVAVVLSESFSAR